MPASPPYAAYAALATSMALVGSYVGLSKLLLALFPVFLLAWLRCAIAALAMLPWLRHAPGEAPLAAADRRVLLGQALVGNVLFSVFMLLGVQATSALAAGVVMAALPAMVALQSRWFLGEAIGPRTASAIVCAAGGMLLLATAPATPSPTGTAAPWWGYALLLAAVACEAGFVVIGKRLSAAVPARRATVLINARALVLFTPLGLWQARSFDAGAVSASTWALLVFYALAASVITVWLWMRGLRDVPAARAGVFTVLLPLSAAAIGILFLGEAATPAHAVALLLALVGLLLATWPRR